MPAVSKVSTVKAGRTVKPGYGYEILPEYAAVPYVVGFKSEDNRGRRVGGSGEPEAILVIDSYAVDLCDIGSGKIGGVGQFANQLVVFTFLHFQPQFRRVDSVGEGFKNGLS